MKVLVIITSYDREKSLRLLIKELKFGMPVDIAIFDDCSEWTVDAEDFNGEHIHLFRNPVHRGKSGFWQTYQDIFNYCKEHLYDYYIILPDDVMPCDDFVAKAIAAYDNIGDCICMCPLVTNRSIVGGCSRWGRMSIKEHGLYFQTNYFDCCGVVKRDFFEALDWRMNRIEPVTNPFMSSGVGKQITLRLQQNGKKMCHVKRTMLSTTADESKMNRLERKRHPMRADFRDNENVVDVYMASLWRGGHVVETAKSLLMQPELATLTICCNNYTDEQFDYVKQRLQNDKVTLFRGDNAKCSNEKLRFMYKGTAKYIAFADDDLIYPAYHLFKMIHGCNIHHAAVSIHGSRLTRYPVLKYYGGDRKMLSWNIPIKEDNLVDIIGNGFGLFKRDWFTPKELKAIYDNAPDISMDDIILSCEFKKKNIRLVVLAHNSGYAKHKEMVTSDNYVYYKYKNNDSFQVNYINTHLTRQMLVGIHTS